MHVFLYVRSEEHTSELQSRSDLVCRLLLEKKKEGGNSNMAISEDSPYNAHVLARPVYTPDMEIKNLGKVDIPKVEIMFDGGDKFVYHNVVVKSDACTVDKNLPGLQCGDLAIGPDLKFSITYQPKDAGNFKFFF